MSGNICSCFSNICTCFSNISVNHRNAAIKCCCDELCSDMNSTLISE